MCDAPRRIQVGKIDLDTIGVAWLLGVTSGEAIQALRGNASAEDLADPNVVCIEVGGSGQVKVNNFDHHGEGSEGLPSATFQAFVSLRGTCCRDCQYESGASEWDFDYQNPLESHYGCGLPSTMTCREQAMARIVKYIDILDRMGPQEIRRQSAGDSPFLSDIVSGIMLLKRNPLEQLLEGVRFLQILVDLNIDAFGSMEEIFRVHPEFRVYAEAHEQNKLMIAQALKDAEWGETQSGLKMAWLETSFPGALGALYHSGAQIAVAFNPNLNGVRKFTVAGNEGIRVNSILSLLNAVEPGWGGPGTGTIIGSPKEGSVMTLPEVVRIVKDNL